MLLTRACLFELEMSPKQSGPGLGLIFYCERFFVLRPARRIGSSIAKLLDMLSDRRRSTPLSIRLE